MTNPNIKGSLVLAVDDSAETLSLLSRTLEGAGMTTLVALDGKQAINIAKKMHPDIILLDAIMPNMDGFETCIELKKISEIKSVPILFMTGLSDTENIVKGFNSGGIDYLTKPINPQELVVRMTTHLANARKTMGAQDALDNIGHNVFAISEFGHVAWSTPEVERLLDVLFAKQLDTELVETLITWLKHKPEIGNKCYFDKKGESLTTVYLGKSVSNDFLIRLIDDSALDEKQNLMDHFPVTPREADVFLWIAKGKTNREIAQILEMSPRTVNKHLEQLFKKLKVENRTAAAGLALKVLQS